MSADSIGASAVGGTPYDAGALIIGARFDTQSSVADKAFDGSAALYQPSQSEYGPNSGANDARSIVSNDIVYTDLASAKAHNREPHVLSSLANKGRRQKRKAGADTELARLALRNQLRPRGVAPDNRSAYDIAKSEPLNVAQSGIYQLQALPLHKRRRFTPGALVEADLPPTDVDRPRATKQNPTADRCTYAVRPVEAGNAADEFQRHVGALLRDPDSWRDALNGRFTGTNTLAAAAKQQVDSDLTKAVLFIGEAVDAGYLTPSASLSGVFARIDAPANSVAASTDGQKSAAALAQFMQLTRSKVSVSTDERRRFGELRNRAGRIANDPRELSTAFGEYNAREGYPADNGAKVQRRALKRSYVARHVNGRVRDDTFGQLRELQLNAPTAAAAAYDAALLERQGRIIGRAVTGEDKNGRVQVNVTVGI